jgi:hypothetical protein
MIAHLISWVHYTAEVGCWWQFCWLSCSCADFCIDRDSAKIKHLGAGGARLERKVSRRGAPHCSRLVMCSENWSVLHLMCMHNGRPPRTVNLRSRPLTSDQIRAARALLRWRAEDLAGAPGVGVATIRGAELATGHTSMTLPNDMAVRRALEAGVEFIDENGGGPGVRLRKRQQEKG